ncbi:hypothetical protein ACFQLX_13555 [Streptomyces polyrhachis]|uniref:Uncharacterized protein n=1 Tax=Streptomyces polyrhachis TaxID=1282885 RepID=A0ABW2GEM7_9ACTN
MEVEPPSHALSVAQRGGRAVLGFSTLGFAGSLAFYLAGDGPPLSRWWPLAACGALVLLSAIVVFLEPFTLVRWRAVLSSVLASCVMLGGIVATLSLISEDDIDLLSAGRVVDRRFEADEYLDADRTAAGRRRIPTGVFLQQLRFTAPNAVQASGFVWQRLPKGFPKKFEGVVFPDAEDSYGTKEVYRDKQPEDGSTTVGWYFKVKLAENFDYERYPFDRQGIRLRLWSKDRADDSMALVPDFRSYPPWQPQQRYGVDPGLVLPGWSTVFSSWSYLRLDYHTTLGGNPRDYHGAYPVPPDLYFNVGIDRDWVSPFFDTLTRWLIVALVIFLALFVYQKDKGELRPDLGFSTWAVITFGVQMLLVVVIDQDSVRLATGPTMAYVEWFALSLYTVIFLVALNAVILTSRRYSPGLEWRDNRVAKLLYWPVLLALIFAATLYVFRPRW